MGAEISASLDFDTLFKARQDGKSWKGIFPDYTIPQQKYASQWLSKECKRRNLKSPGAKDYSAPGAFMVSANDPAMVARIRGYYEEGLTTRQIRDRMGCTKGQIAKFIHRSGLSKEFLTPGQKKRFRFDEFVKLRDEGKTWRQIAAEVGEKESTVFNFYTKTCRALGIERVLVKVARPPGQKPTAPKTPRLRAISAPRKKPNYRAIKPIEDRQEPQRLWVDVMEGGVLYGPMMPPRLCQWMLRTVGTQHFMCGEPVVGSSAWCECHYGRVSPAWQYDNAAAVA